MGYTQFRAGLEATDSPMTSPWPSPAVMESLAAVTPCRPGEVIYARGDPVEYWYRLVSGLARKCSVLPDGRRQIVDFLLRRAIPALGSRPARDHNVPLRDGPVPRDRSALPATSAICVAQDSGD
jgi:hypothetical protein